MKASINTYAKKQSLYAGLGYVVIFFAAIFANFYVLEGIFGGSEYDGLSLAIQENIGIFQLGSLAFFITMVIDVALAWQLYQITKHVDHELAGFSSLLRLIYAAILGIALYHLSQMSFLATSDLVPTVENADWLILNHKIAFNKIWVMGMVLFGIHLMMQGYLFIKGTSFSSWIGYGLLFAGSGYIFDGGGQLILADYASWSFILDTWVLVGGVIGEMAFMIYLFVVALRKEA